MGRLSGASRILTGQCAFGAKPCHYRLREPASEDWAVLVPIEGDGIQLSLSKVTSGQGKAPPHGPFYRQPAAGGATAFGVEGDSGRVVLSRRRRLCGAARPGWQSILCCTKIGRVKKWEEKREEFGLITKESWLKSIMAGICIGVGGIVYLSLDNKMVGAGAVCQRTVYHLHLGV